MAQKAFFWQARYWTARFFSALGAAPAEVPIKLFTAILVFAESGTAELVFNELSGSADLVFAESGTAELIF